MLEKIEKDEAIVICKKAIDNWGTALQKIVAMEELAELISALSSALKNQHNNIEEEAADVEIMCIQLRLMYGNQKVNEAHEEINEFSNFGLIESTIKRCSLLQQSISKSLRDIQNNSIYKNIALVENSCRAMRKKFNGDEIEEIKQVKLKKLKGVVW
ncbi:hypothetical protein B0P06_005299 [Clostridium saccharoperbutylacetonicum]|uniref:Uncharacterized protein n=1 Tax=Clostridium saccharoperbutylacetonicum N1-4(HMT) TaxID=931276 RepID=M1LTS1_9CLOT|nr:hypothetical protein [Clostridium saccharoperbutylacetonicum]AGF56435.1 hypothetical protein Cspa_c26700 [Clostridium saccharoperbutylacetonicum N1-4(HMT)]NRT62820.1 hypothetical protein [Clostridium saccharoperbutylacetonicum]NSB26174.1 hypothetical protein [Clostridium saccharoperbutylacetonicum]NSB45528.1 hypothetical protein [Clostridium saccharoperbutylacetonicum]